MNARNGERELISREGSEQSALLPLTMAIAEYDRTRPILDGRVQPEGIALNINTMWIGDFCRRPVYEEYDVAEFSLSWYLAARCRGEPVVALPVFPLRMPVFAYMLCRADSPYTCPQDLVGKRVGTPRYRYTVNLWLRGILKEHYGVAPSQLQWVTADTEGAGYVVPDGIDVKVVEGSTPEQLLERREVDAIFITDIPDSYMNGTPEFRRLFPDCRREMRSYFGRTGIFPITHTVVMKESLCDREPWIAQSLVNAFMKAQRECDDYYHANTKHLSLPETLLIQEEQRAAYGANPWAQGFSANRHVIETFARYAYEQGYIPRLPKAEELFPANTLSL